MVSVTSASRYVTLGSRYQSRPSVYIRGLIARNWPEQFQFELKINLLSKILVLPKRGHNGKFLGWYISVFNLDMAAYCFSYTNIYIFEAIL